MEILVACEESQAVTKELRRLGHEAYSCDIIECSGGHPEWHIQGDVLDILSPKIGYENTEPEIIFYTATGTPCRINKWDMIIAFPPCTYMSKAGARWMFPKAGIVDEKRLAMAMEAKEFFYRFLNADCQRIAIENPRPLKIVELPKPSQVIQPYEYGHPYSKATCLWLKGLPLLEPTNVVGFYKPFVPSNTGGFSRGEGGSKGAALRGEDAKHRSKTFPGIAKAMAEQWAGVCEEAK